MTFLNFLVWEELTFLGHPINGPLLKNLIKSITGTLLKGCNLETPECGLGAKRIVNGEDANVSEWPWAAIIGKPAENGGISVWCGGSLIGNSVVLTAAHCFEGSNQPTMVRLGELDYTDNSDGALHQDIEIANVFIHPE